MWLFIFLIILILASLGNIESFVCNDPNVEPLYKEWSNGGVDGNLLRTDQISDWGTHANIREPQNSPTDQLVCQNYAKRTCLDVRGDDRKQYCLSGQYGACMDGRQSLLWGNNTQ
jgi:hypothetical protein